MRKWQPERSDNNRLLVFTDVSPWPGQAVGQMLGGVAR
jgi:hypothetical protein